ncbi:MAG: isochorismatase family protein [Duncaniella sp.]|nr:isochorismatase family protein [Duncaniella sp.]
MRRMLLIVDPQVDFINGSLPVPGAPEAMDALAEYIRTDSDRYEVIGITADSHPSDHNSFRSNGGEWPVHCVSGTEGAAIWPAIYSAAGDSGRRVEVYHKGDRTEVEEYSVFENPLSRKALVGLVRDLGITDIDICGLAGDVCVLSSLRDGIRLLPEVKFHVLLPYSPSLDGGKMLESYINSRES